ncbi:MAG: ATP-binding protein [Acidobacteria bacterium]|nr:ATP-binding protein [Acidobacteriota bacterium]
MRQPRLRTRLTLWFSATILLILLPVLAGVALIQWQSMRAALDHHLTEDMEFALQMIVSRDGELVWRVEADTDPGYDAGPRRWVEVYDAEGRPRYLRGIPEERGIWRTLPDVTADPKGPNTRQTPSGAHVRLLTVQRPLDGEPLWIRVARSEDGLRRDLRQVLLIFAVIGPLAIVVASVAGYLISGRALAPLSAMAERARSISADRLSERLPGAETPDELGQLATVFNATFARLQDSFDRLKRFTADVSHELRTPLTAIRSVGEVGLQESRTVEEHQEVIGSMLEEVDRLSRVVETLLTLSRWESGRVAPQAAPMDLAGVANHVVNQLSVLADERNVELRVAVHAPLTVMGDDTMIRQAVINVVDNAIKFTPTGSRVTISSVSTPSEHHLVVDDQGPGIPEDQRHRVVERFYRLDRDRESGPEGTGLGLAIVQWAVTANRGRLELGSNPDGGARVTIVLPRT